MCLSAPFSPTTIIYYKSIQNRYFIYLKFKMSSLYYDKKESFFKITISELFIDLLKSSFNLSSIDFKHPQLLLNDGF